MILEEINQYKRQLRLYINGLACLGAGAFTILQFNSDHRQLGFATLLCGFYFATVSYFLYKDGRYLWKGRGLLFVLPTTLLYAVYNNPDFGVYWIYVGAIGLFLMLELVDAVISVSIFTILAFYLVAPHFSDEVLYRIYATVTLVAIFSFCLSYLIDRLLITLNTTATHDPLTKALNRHTFHKSINTALIEKRRNHVTGVLFLFDLDHFKRVNDDHGHLVGDNILKEIAKLVQTRIRETDQFFRYGGEEFAILLRHTVLQNAAFVAEDIRTLIRDHTFAGDLNVTISGGLSEVHSSIDVNEWIDRSDTALYEAKSNGRNCIKIHVPALE